MTPDALDAAIAAAEKKDLVQVEMLQVQIKLLGRDDRPALLAIPRDVTEIELLNMVGNVLAIGDQLRAQRPPPIQVAHQLPQAPRT